MLTYIIIIFVIGYIAIALEHPLKINKAASALFIGIMTWTLYVLGSSELLPMSNIPDWFQGMLAHEGDSPEGHHLVVDYLVKGQLLHALGEIAGILFFLMGAMTIVELVDAYEGFSIITNKIKSSNKVALLWIVGILTFFLSAVLDNLTTTIVMISLIRKLIGDSKTRLFFAGIIVIAANAGGAWTVIGDVTTTMLWIKGKISTVNIMKELILPSIVCLVVPLIMLTFRMKGKVERPVIDKNEGHDKQINPVHTKIMFFLGLAGLLFVPVFKTFTHLPPFMGMLLSLSVIWIVSEFLNSTMDEATSSSTNVLSVLKKVDTSSVLFFLGILLAISALGATGFLRNLAFQMDNLVGDKNVIAIIIGLVSSVVDNVPLVAAGMEMYSMPMDDPFWTFLAYCAGTGGSCLIIGSAAGVAAMGMEKIDFIWYMKNISIWALTGYLAGAGVFLLQSQIMH